MKRQPYKMSECDENGKPVTANCPHCGKSFGRSFMMYHKNSCGKKRGRYCSDTDQL